MKYLFRTLVFILCITLSDQVLSGRHDFWIEQPGELPQPIRTLRLDKEYDKKFHSSNWSSQINRLFDEHKEGDIWQVVIVLSDFTMNYLRNVTNFLCSLAQTKDVNCYTPVLIIDQGTSIKFNVIYPGIEAFFRQVPKARVHYIHKGTKIPKAARTSLGRLAPLNEGVEYSNEISLLCGKMKGLKLQEEDDRISRRPTYRDIDLESGREDLSPTGDATAMLRAAVNCEELAWELKKLKKRWNDLHNSEWPPFSLKETTQMVSVVGAGELAQFRDQPLQPIVLTVEGLFPDEAEILPSICRVKPSLRCIIVKNSGCRPIDFGKFTEYQKDDDPNEQGVMREDGVDFIDVETAFNTGGGSITDLESHYKKIDRPGSLSYFVYLPSAEFAPILFEKLELQAKSRHQSYWVFRDYMQLLQSDLMREIKDSI
jgi:hypothetical protein